MKISNGFFFENHKKILTSLLEGIVDGSSPAGLLFLARRRVIAIQKVSVPYVVHVAVY